MKNLHLEPATQFILPCIVTIFSKGWFGNKYLILVKSLDCAAKSRITWLGTHCNQCIGQKLQFGLATTFFLLEPNHFFLLIQGLLGCKQSEWVAQSDCCSNIYTIKILDCAEWGEEGIQCFSIIDSDILNCQVLSHISLHCIAFHLQDAINEPAFLFNKNEMGW